MSKFADQLVLARWALAQLGLESFDPISTLLKAPEFEGWAEDGGSYFVRQLIARFPKTRPVSDEMLRDYDSNIVRHWKHITQRRNTLGPTLYPLYFQYVGLLFTEIYLDWYFRDPKSLIASLNDVLTKGAGQQWSMTAAAQAPVRGRRRSPLPEFSPFTEADLNKIAFWMATGSGKTLLMHCHIRQYIYYAGRAGTRQDLNRVILLTPNEGLSRQHLEEFELSGIEAALFERGDQRTFEYLGRGVDIIDIHKLGETSKEKVVAVGTFEGNNLVLVDEGHRGSGGEEWMDRRARLCANGFSFEYSATFGQAIKAASGTRQKQLLETYSKSILFDYSYKFFYNDGYGKDFQILNLAQEREEETRPLYLTGAMLAFYQQCRRFADGGAALVPYLLESPLMVFVGGSVTGQRQNQEESDLVAILKFLGEFIVNRKETVRRIERFLRRQAGLLAGGEDTFARAFPLVEEIWKPEQAAELFGDLLRHVFNAPSGGQLHIVRLQGSDGEIGLRVGENPWFGVVNVGDAKKLCDLCQERKGDDDRYVVDSPMEFSGSLFGEIRQPGSGIRVLAGAKKFTEGWSSWRVSSMGLMNVGKKEGSEIIQLFGRGVRLKGYRFKLKRTSALDALDFDEESPRGRQQHPKHIELLETLNIFGVKSDYMKEFQEYLEEEGVGEKDRRELIVLPTIQLPELQQGKVKLTVIGRRKDMPDFKKERKLVLDSLEDRLGNRVSADWYPRLQKQASTKELDGPAGQVNVEPLRPDHLAFLNWDQIWFDVERHKKEKALYNVVFSPVELRRLMSQTWWYELRIPLGYLDFRLDRRGLWQEIVVHLLQGYLERFYAFHKREFEAPYLEYQDLTPDNGLLLKQYQLLVKKSERQLIHGLRTLAEKFTMGEFESFSFDHFDLFQANHHLYQPLIHLTRGSNEESLIKVVPTHLNEGEKQFVDALETLCRAEGLGILADCELFLLRNHNSESAISFFSESGFRPDFVLWILKGDSQTIAFVDPKGLHNLTGTFNNPKVQLAARIKELETRLNRADIRLESFLLAQTHRNQLRWMSPTNPQRIATASEYRDRHIILAKDDPDYVRDLISELVI